MRKLLAGITLSGLLVGVPVWAQDAPAPGSPAATPAVPPEIQLEFELGQCRSNLAQLKYQIYMLKTEAHAVAPPPQKQESSELQTDSVKSQD